MRLQLKMYRVYQEFLARSLTDKYSTLSSQMDKVINDANTEISILRDKLSGMPISLFWLVAAYSRWPGMHLEQKNLEQKNHELAQKYQEKIKTNHRFEKLYQNLKQKQLAGGIQLAAEYDAEDTLHAAAGDHFGNANYQQTMPSRAGSNGSGGSGGRRNNANPWENQSHNQGYRGGLQSSRECKVDKRYYVHL